MEGCALSSLSGTLNVATAEGATERERNHEREYKTAAGTDQAATLAAHRGDRHDRLRDHAPYRQSPDRDDRRPYGSEVLRKFHLPADVYGVVRA